MLHTTTLKVKAQFYIEVPNPLFTQCNGKFSIQIFLKCLTNFLQMRHLAKKMFQLFQSLNLTVDHSILAQYVLSGPIVVVHLFSQHAPLCDCRAVHISSARLLNKYTTTIGPLGTYCPNTFTVLLIHNLYEISC